MSEHTKKELSKKQQDAIVHLIQEPTISAAAGIAAVSERTLYRWLSEPDFQVEYRKAKNSIFTRALDRLQLNAQSAAETLISLLDDANPPYVRMNAAVHLLTLGIKSFENEQLAERIEKLENRDQFDSFPDPVATTRRLYVE